MSLFPDQPPAPTRSSRFAKSPRSKSAASAPSPLPEGWVLARCDGGSRGNPGPSGFGAIVKSGDGETLAELSEFLGIRTNNVAEYHGLLAVLAWALEHGRTKVRVVADSELMVNQVRGRYRVNSPDLKPLHEEARRRIARLEAFDIQHALRHENKEADRLANEAMDRGTGKASGTPVKPSAPARILSPAGAASPGSLANAGHTPQAPAGDLAPSGPLRGFVRDGVVHPLGTHRLREGSFVKILPE